MAMSKRWTESQANKAKRTRRGASEIDANGAASALSARQLDGLIHRIVLLELNVAETAGKGQRP